jgi:hypothetical protein
MAQKPLMSQGLRIIKLARSHSDTPQSLELLWISDQPVAETSTWQHPAPKETDIHARGGIWTHNPSKRAAADPDRPLLSVDRRLI